MGAFAKDVSPVSLWAGEANSASCGGAPNVSETFASALWSLDFLSELNKAGVVGANFHGGPHPNPSAGSDTYSPVAFDDAGTVTRRYAPTDMLPQIHVLSFKTSCEPLAAKLVSFLRTRVCATANVCRPHCIFTRFAKPLLNEGLCYG